MPDIVDDAFAAVGETAGRPARSDTGETRLPRVVRRRQPLDVHSDADAMAAEVERFAGRGRPRVPAAAGMADPALQVEFDGFIAANFDSPLSLLTPQLARLAAIGGFRRLGTMVRGSSPTSGCGGFSPSRRSMPGCHRSVRWRCTRSSLTWTPWPGVYFPRGGMRALPDAMAAAAVDAGVEFRYGRPVTAARTRGDRVTPCRPDRRANRLPTPWCSRPNCRTPIDCLARDTAPAAPAATRAVGGRGPRRLPRGRPDSAITPSFSVTAWEQTFATSSTKEG